MVDLALRKSKAIISGIRLGKTNAIVMIPKLSRIRLNTFDTINFC
jgi:hypothetical protein